mmetsp:Transcript_21705/g.45660  ORF Transcript_21705/g.45660 Transcript_21705/m.45660 type:complete len:304 (-) Transcript_21705:231-1142(-)
MAAGRTNTISTRGAILLAAAAGVALIASGGNDPMPLQVAAFSTPSSASARARSSQQQQQYNSIEHNNPLSVLEMSANANTKSTAAEVSSSSSQTTAKQKQTTASMLASVSLAIAVATTALPVEPANAYIPSDYASETVQNVLQELKAAKGNIDETFRVYEGIAGIITEGNGVGGQINYQGVQLERGYVADEDTSIYNPGLSLLTESEKERLVEGVIDARKAGLKSNQWSENNEYAFAFLRQKLDPLHTVELRGFLGIVPFYGAAIYLAVLAVQQLFRDGFQIAYLVGVAAFVLPALGLILAGP